jgi:REP-associated tyrosine transposase
MPHSFTDLLVHAIFSTKDRRAFLADEIQTELFAYIGGTVRKIGGKALLVNGTSDHVHLLVRIPADMSVAECLRMVKANSSKWVHERWPERPDFAWQSGYAAFSVSLSNREHVYRYIQNQRLHHEGVSFADEIAAFVRKYGGNPTQLLD